jgi:hypothetical protein
MAYLVAWLEAFIFLFCEDKHFLHSAIAKLA